MDFTDPDNPKSRPIDVNSPWVLAFDMWYLDPDTERVIPHNPGPRAPWPSENGLFRMVKQKVDMGDCRRPVSVRSILGRYVMHFCRICLLLPFSNTLLCSTTMEPVKE